MNALRLHTSFSVNLRPFQVFPQQRNSEPYYSANRISVFLSWLCRRSTFYFIQQGILETLLGPESACLTTNPSPYFRSPQGTFLHLKWPVQALPLLMYSNALFNAIREKSVFFKITLPLLYIAKIPKNWKSVSTFWGQKFRQSPFFIDFLLWGLIHSPPLLGFVALLEPLEIWGSNIVRMTSYHPDLTKSFSSNCIPEFSKVDLPLVIITLICLPPLGELGKGKTTFFFEGPKSQGSEVHSLSGGSWGGQSVLDL